MHARTLCWAQRSLHPALPGRSLQTIDCFLHGAFLCHTRVRFMPEVQAYLCNRVQGDGGWSVLLLEYHHSRLTQEAHSRRLKILLVLQAATQGLTCCGCCGGDESGRKYVNSSSRSRCARKSSATCGHMRSFGVHGSDYSRARASVQVMMYSFGRFWPPCKMCKF